MSLEQSLTLGCLVVAVYHYAAYPLLMVVLSVIKRPHSSVPARNGAESVTVIIAAYNEERVIGDKLRNTLSLEYPAEKLSIVVAADGSSDRTAEIAKAAGSRVQCLHDPVRRGKGHALNRAVAAATGAVVVLSDANNTYSTDAIEFLVARLRQPGVGGVTGAKKVVMDAKRAASVGDGLYWRYESRIKTAESDVGGTVSADGEIFAMRREDYEPIPERTVNDDLHLTLSLVRRGLRVEYEPRAVAMEEGSLTIADDFGVKVRMIAGGIQNVHRDWRTICSSGWFCFKFISHKLLRWLMPVFLLLLLASNAASAEHAAFRALLFAQIAFYGLAAVGAVLNSRGLRPMAFYVPFYFVAMNVAAAAGLLTAARGGQSPLWRKAAR